MKNKEGTKKWGNKESKKGYERMTKTTFVIKVFKLRWD